MPRFFVDENAVSSDTVAITGADARHIARSLRMAVGDGITVCTTGGRELTCRLTRIRDELCEAEILSSRDALGAPFASSFVVRKPRPEKIGVETERLNRIASEAAKQCRRGAIPTVTPPLSFEEMLEQAGQADLPLFCYEGEGTRPLPELLPDACPQTVSVVTGSEGGFSDGEAAAARAAGLSLVGLGKRILRCETAPLFVLASLAFRYEL